MKATLTAYYNREPKELAVEKPAGEWMAFEAFLRSLGFRPARHGGHVVPGAFVFWTASAAELEKVAGIVRAGGGYLTGGNMGFTFQC